MLKGKKGSELMEASACLTLYNEDKGVRRMLNYISTQRKIVEDLVIVSDCCHDSTDEIVKEWISENLASNVWFYSRKERYGRADAIRLCLSKTKNDINILLAGDIVPIGDCFKDLLSYFEDPNVGAVTGHPVLLNTERTIADCLSRIMWTSHDESRKTLSSKGELYHLSGEVMAIRKSALKGFDNYSGLVDDAMMGYLIKREGYKVLFADDVKYYMLYPSSLTGYLNVRKRCCYGRVELARKTGLKDNPYYELSHNEYIVNVLKATEFKPKNLLSLTLGVTIEVLCRLYYNFKKKENINIYDELWQPAKDTKW